MTRRRGFALITALWVLVVASAIAAAGAAAGLDSAAAHKNRVNATRAYWRAVACADRARAAADRLLSESQIGIRDSVWRALDALVAQSPEMATTGCTAQLVAAGSQLNANMANEAELTGLFSAMELDSPQALADNLMDWIDADAVPRQFGAEAGSYVDRRRPRNAPIANLAELRYVRGFEQLALDSVLSVDSARISLANAPLVVLASLPGFTNEALARVGEWRLQGRQITDLLVLANTLSPAGYNAILNSYPEIMRRSAVDPEAWTIAGSATAGYPPIASRVELRVTRAQSRAALLWRRVWR